MGVCIAYTVLVSELELEGVADGFGGGSVAAAGVAHQDEDVLGAVGGDLDHFLHYDVII